MWFTSHLSDPPDGYSIMAVIDPEDGRVLYEQCRNLQLVHRDTEQADTYMAKQESI